MIILQQSAPMPFVSYFLQFPTLALDFGRPEPDAPMSANDENRNKHLTADCLPAPESTRPAAHCPVLYTQWAKLPTAVYPSSPSGSITHPGCYCRPVLLYISVHVGVESELLAVKSVLNYARWYFTAFGIIYIITGQCLPVQCQLAYFRYYNNWSWEFNQQVLASLEFDYFFFTWFSPTPWGRYFHLSLMRVNPTTPPYYWTLTTQRKSCRNLWETPWVCLSKCFIAAFF